MSEQIPCPHCGADMISPPNSQFDKGACELDMHCTNDVDCGFRCKARVVLTQVISKSNA